MNALLYEVSVLAVVASEKGVVVGRLAYREDGDLIDCQRMGVGGKAIPPNVDKVSLLSVRFPDRAPSFNLPTSFYLRDHASCE